jgi:hypothetical protein
MLHVRGSRAQQADIAIINDAAHARDALQAIREEKHALAERADAVAQAEDLIRQLVGMVDAVTTRIDAFEENQRAQLEAEEQAAASAAEFALPPGVADEDEPPFHPAGDLHAVSPSTPEDEEQLAAGDSDDDNEGDLPNELLEDVPPVTGTDPEFPGPRELETRNPVGISW